jgi:hypothetical protein
MDLDRTWTALAEPILASLVMLNVNAGRMTCEALDSVFTQTIAGRLKVIVVDNGSRDGSPALLRERFGERITLIESPINLGFAGGNNLAFRQAEGKYLLLLNNDAVAETHWAEALIAAAEANHAAMATSKIVTYHDHSLIDCVGHNIYRDGLSRSRGNWQRDTGQYDRLEESLYASGCAALYLRDAVEEWGGFDERFFAYQEDVDLGLKLRLSGHKCMYVPTAVVYHYGSRAEGQNPFPKVYLIERNRVWVMLRFFPWSWIVASPWHTFRRLIAAWKAASRGQGRIGQYAKSRPMVVLAWTILHAWLSAAAHVPGELAQRRRILGQRGITDEEFKSLLRRFEAPLSEMAFV